MDAQTYEILQQLIEWHKNRVDGLNLVLEKKDADIQLGDQTIKAGSAVHKGVVIGVTVALDSLGELPISFGGDEDDE